MEMLSSSFFLVSIVLAAFLATSVSAQNCPYSPICSCYPSGNGLLLTCSGSSPERIRSEMEYYKPYGPIASLSINGIAQSVFSYVPDDFLAGNQIPSVKFTCSHSHSVSTGHLTFSAFAFTDSTGKCELTGNLTITDCNIRQFNTVILNNCNQLEKLAFMDSHVDNIIEIPTLESLKNFTVYYPRMWTGATQKGLSRLSLAREAKLPLLRYLDLTGNSLTNDSIGFIPQLTTIEEMHLESNLFNTVPVLTDSTNLHSFSLTLNGTITDIAVHLPNPRTQSRVLSVLLYSSLSSKIYNVTSLEGMFAPLDTLRFNVKMDEFKEDVFLAPLKSGLTIYLDGSSEFQCACKISWLVRDNPDLLSQVYSGYCIDGRPFDQIPAEELICCSNESLIKRVSRQEKEIDRLESTVKKLRSVIDSSRNSERLSEL